MFCIGIINYITATILPQFINFKNLAAYQVSCYRNYSWIQKSSVCIPNFGKLKDVFCILSSKYSENSSYLSQYFYDIQKKNIILIRHMEQEAEYKLRWCMHSLPKHCWKILEITSSAFHRQKLCYETLHLSLSIIIQKSSPTEYFQSPLKSFNILLALYLQQFVRLFSCWRKALMLAMLKEWYPWQRSVGQNIVCGQYRTNEVKTFWKSPGDCILCYDGQVICSHKGEKHLQYEYCHQFLL